MEVFIRGSLFGVLVGAEECVEKGGGDTGFQSRIGSCRESRARRSCSGLVCRWRRDCWIELRRRDLCRPFDPLGLELRHVDLPFRRHPLALHLRGFSGFGLGGL